MGIVNRILIFSLILGLSSACGKSDTVRLTLLTGLEPSTGAIDLSKLFSMTLPAPLTGSTQVCRQKDLRVGFFVPSTGQEVLAPINLVSENGLALVYSQTASPLGSLIDQLHFAPIQLDVPKDIPVNIGIMGAITTGFPSVSSSLNDGVKDCPRFNFANGTVFPQYSWSLRGIKSGTFSKESAISLPIFVLPSSALPSSSVSTHFFKLLNAAGSTPVILAIKSFPGPSSAGFEQGVHVNSNGTAYIPAVPRFEVASYDDITTQWHPLSTGGSNPHTLITKVDFNAAGSLDLFDLSAQIPTSPIITFFRFP